MKNTMLTIAVAFLFLIVIPGYGISEVDNNLSFHTQTIAICEYGEASVYCHDELVVNCGNEEYVLPKKSDNITCGEISLHVTPMTAFAVFDKDWKDPRDLAE